MNDKPLRPCKKIGCAALTRKTWCEAHQPDWRERERKDSAAWHFLYNTKVWKRMRTYQLLIVPFCSECAKHDVRTRASDVDHIVPHEGQWHLFMDSTNLQSLCHACHSRKTMREGVAPLRVNKHVPHTKIVHNDH